MPSSILDKIFNKEEKTSSFFLTLLFYENKIKTASCVLKNTEVEVLQTAEKNYQNEEELLVAVDEAISLVEEKFPEKITTDKVVLGLPTEKIKEGKIEEETLGGIKNFCQKLNLKPIGFVEIPTAINHFLQKKDNGLESLILTRFGEKLSVSLIKIGKITNQINLDRSQNHALDLEKALKSFIEVEIFPSKILLYDDSPLENIQQDLMNYPWTTKASFLHLPKIEVSAEDFDTRAVAFSGAGEIIKTISETVVEEVVQIETGENFGFVNDQDVADVPAVVKIKPPQVKREFPVIKLPKLKLPDISFLRNFFSRKKLGGLWILGFLGILLAITVAFFWYWPSVTVELLLQTQKQQNKEQIILDQKITSVDESSKAIPQITIEIEKSLTKKIETTGKKLIGEPAKGTVTIYNKTNNSKTFNKGLVILSSGNLKFSFNESITVASASGDITDPVSGKAEVNVTAVNIGPEANLGAGQIFSITDYPTDSYVAKNSSAFSGGTSREITVVSIKDQEKLFSLASQETTELAKAELLQKKDNQEMILAETLTGSVTSKKFDKEVNDETSQLSLDLNMKFNAIGYHQDDLLKVLEKMINSSLPEGYELKKDAIEINVGSGQKKKDETVVLQINYSVSLSPKISTEEIRKNLLGKSIKETEQYLGSLSVLAGYELKLNRKLPFFNNHLPRVLSNIRVETSGYK